MSSQPGGLDGGALGSGCFVSRCTADGAQTLLACGRESLSAGAFHKSGESEEEAHLNFKFADDELLAP